MNGRGTNWDFVMVAGEYGPPGNGLSEAGQSSLTY